MYIARALLIFVEETGTRYHHKDTKNTEKAGGFSSPLKKQRLCHAEQREASFASNTRGIYVLKILHFVQNDLFQRAVRPAAVGTAPR